MKKIYLVMSEELLDHEEWEKDVCRGFDNLEDANTFKSQLVELHRENKHYENTTRFYIKTLEMGLPA